MAAEAFLFVKRHLRGGERGEERATAGKRRNEQSFHCVLADGLKESRCVPTTTPAIQIVRPACSGNRSQHRQAADTGIAAVLNVSYVHRAGAKDLHGNDETPGQGLDTRRMPLHLHTNGWFRSEDGTQGQHRDATRLLDAARDVIRAKGYTATTVDDICAAAGVSKGSFFHHFASKEQLGIAAIEQFGAMAAEIFGSAPYTQLPDPRDRVLGYVDFRTAMLQGDIAQFTCLLGTTVQEVYATHPDLRAACDQEMSAHIAVLTRDIAAAKRTYAPNAPWSAEGVGYFMQSVLQGAFIFAKAKQGPEVAVECLVHLRRYLETLLGQPRNNEPKGEDIDDQSTSKTDSGRNAFRDTAPDLRRRGRRHRVLQEGLRRRGDVAAARRRAESSCTPRSGSATRW